MSISERCVAVIPCLDEGWSIGALVSEVRSYLATVIVVDDGSADDTAAQARAAGAVVLRHETSAGKGSALKTGFSYAHKAGFQWAIALDGDGQHAPRDIAGFFEAAEASDFQMLVGDRMKQPHCMPVVRRWVNRWMSFTLSRYCGQQLPDSQCGFRLLHLPSWARLDFTSQHFEIESELLVRFLASGLKVGFVPVETRYGCEHSKIRPLRDSLRWLHWWREIRRELAASRELTGVTQFSVATLE